MPELPSSSAFPSASPGAELSKPQRKVLASAGHLLERFAAACDALRVRVQAGRIPLPQLWRDAVSSTAAAALAGDGWFVMEFALLPEGKLRMHPQLLAHDASAQSVTAWTAENSGAAPEPLLPVPEGFDIPWWTAFLRLRQLRDFWESELRRSSLEQLSSLLPDAWLLDAAPLPPGAVIPRLEIGSWEILSESMAQGRRFEIHRLGTGAATHLADASAWHDYWRVERAAHPASADVLAESFQKVGVPMVRVIYAKKEARVEMVEIGAVFEAAR